MAWELCTKNDVVSLTYTSEVTLSDFWSDTVEGMIRQYLGMPYLGKRAVVIGELHDGDGTNILIVRRPPILSVERVVVDGVLLTPSEYVVGTSSIQLRFRVFNKEVLNVAVDYTSGSALDPVSGRPEVDPIVRFTAAAMLTAILNYRNRGGADASIKWGTAPTREGEDTPNVNIGLTSHLVTIMRRMLRRERLRVR